MGSLAERSRQDDHDVDAHQVHLARRTATWVLLIALLVILAMVFASVGVIAERGGTGPSGGLSQTLVTFRGAYHQVLTFMQGLGRADRKVGLVDDVTARQSGPNRTPRRHARRSRRGAT